jgi:biotin carboxyl carrier protein
MAGLMTVARSGRLVVVEPSPSSRLPADETRRIDPEAASVEWPAPARALVRDEVGLGRVAIVGADRPAGPSARRTLEIVVGGWRFELEVEDARRADLAERARRDRSSAVGSGGPLEIHAMIPGRVATVSVAPGDVVAVGQTLLVVEAMKMQNELRAPRDGTVVRVAIGAGETIDLGDLLVVLG